MRSNVTAIPAAASAEACSHFSRRLDVRDRLLGRA